jgi:hypothetical protein
MKEGDGMEAVWQFPILNNRQNAISYVVENQGI